MHSMQVCHLHVAFHFSCSTHIYSHMWAKVQHDERMCRMVYPSPAMRIMSRHSDVHVVAWKYRKNCKYHNNNIYWRQLTRKQYGSIVPLRVFAAQNSSSKYLVSV